MTVSKLARMAILSVGLQGVFADVRSMCGTSREPVDLAAYAKSKIGLSQFQQQARITPSTVSSNGSTDIPVYFHIITSSSGDGDVSDSDLNLQIDVMNAGFSGQDKPTCGDTTKTGASDTAFRFIKVGADRTANDSWYTATLFNGDDRPMKEKLRQGGCDTLNFYINNMGLGLLGWATWPTDCASDINYDGVVVLRSSLPGGSTNNFNEGDTATHEVGHWIGLYHTFNNGCSAPGDEVEDTPTQESPSSGCPTGKSSCGTADGDDPIYNFMDYSYDCCMFQFTPKQAERMDFYHKEYRQSDVITNDDNDDGPFYDDVNDDGPGDYVDDNDDGPDDDDDNDDGPDDADDENDGPDDVADDDGPDDDDDNDDGPDDVDDDDGPGDYDYNDDGPDDVDDDDNDVSTVPSSSPTFEPSASPTNLPSSPPSTSPTDPSPTNVPSSPPSTSPTDPSVLSRPCLKVCTKKSIPKWKKNCSKNRKKCGGCDECLSGKFVKCKHPSKKCKMEHPWKKKCNSPNCAGCPECLVN